MKRGQTGRWFDPAKDPAFEPNAVLADPRTNSRGLPRDLLSVVQRLQRALALADALNKRMSPTEQAAQRPRPAGRTQRFPRALLDDPAQGLRVHERIPEMDWFIGVYGRSKDSAMPSDRVREALPRWEPQGESQQLMAAVLNNRAFLMDLENYQRWLLSEGQRFVCEVLPPRINEFMKAEWERYQGEAGLADILAKSSIAIQLATLQNPLVQRLSDYPHGGPWLDWEQSKDLTQYEIDQAEREYWRNREVLSDRPMSRFTQPDPALDRKFEQRRTALRDQASSHAFRHYGNAFSRLSPGKAAEALLISFHPIAALVFNDGKLRGALASALRGPPDLVRGALRGILEAAFQQLRECHDAFVRVTSGAASEVPWKRLRPVLHLFAHAVSLNEPRVLDFAVRSVDGFLNRQSTASETAKCIGLVAGIAAFTIGIAILTGGTSTMASLAFYETAAAVAALLADGVGFAFQAVEEREAEVLNRYALVSAAMDRFPQGTLGTDLFAYFVFMVLGNLVARSLGPLLARSSGGKVAEEIRKHARAVLQDLKTDNVSRVVAQADAEIIAETNRLAGVANRGTHPRPEAPGTYAIAPDLTPMRYVPANDAPRLTKERESAKSKLDPEVVEIADQNLGFDIVDVADEARRLGVDPDIMILHTALFRVEAIGKLVKVRRELIRIQRELNEIAEAKTALNRMSHPRKKDPPTDVVAERAKLQAKEAALREEEAEAKRWWEAAKLTRTIQGMGDWHEAYLAMNVPSYTLAIRRNNPAFDAINGTTNGIVSAKMVRIDEIAAVSMKQSTEVGVAAGKSAIDVAIRKFGTDQLLKAIAQWPSQFPGKPIPKDIAVRPREIELAFLVGEPSKEIQAGIARQLNEYLVRSTAGEAATYTLTIRYLSQRELMGLNRKSEIDRLKGLLWPKMVGVKPMAAEQRLSTAASFEDAEAGPIAKVRAGLNSELEAAQDSDTLQGQGVAPR